MIVVDDDNTGGGVSSSPFQRATKLGGFSDLNIDSHLQRALDIRDAHRLCSERFYLSSTFPGQGGKRCVGTPEPDDVCWSCIESGLRT